MSDLSGTITAGGVSQVIGLFNPARRGLIFQPGNEDKWLAFTADAEASSPSILVQAGDTLILGAEFKELIVRRISVLGATTTSKFTAHDSFV